jgi:hypothetical protein
MRRAVVLCIAAVLAVLVAGIATGWLLANLQRSTSPAESLPAEQAPVALPAEPKRGPELYGIIEEIRRPSAGWLIVRLACRPPERPEQKSSQSECEGERRSVYIVHVHDGTGIRQRAGGSGELAEQQLVSVWWQGEVLLSKPPQVRAEWVVIEQP